MKRKPDSIALLQSLYKLRNLFHLSRLNVWVMEGKERWTGKPISVTYAGHQINKNYLSHLVFNNTNKETHSGKIWIWNALKCLNRDYTDSSMAIIEMHKTPPDYVMGNNEFLVPSWIDGELDLSTVLTQIGKSVTIKKHLRKIRKNGLEYEVSRDRNVFSDFYNYMYLPYITRVYGNCAILHSHEDMMSKVPHSELLLVKKESNHIAGSVLIYENGGVRIRELGVKDGNPEYVKAGAIAALYWYEILYLKEKGIGKVDLGGSRAWIGDGVLQFKKKWGMQLTRARSPVFLIRLLRQTEGMKAFLVHSPFIYTRKSLFYGALFLEREMMESEEDFRRLHKDSYFPGMAKLRIYLFGKENENITIPEDLRESISIHFTRNLFNS